MERAFFNDSWDDESDPEIPPPISTANHVNSYQRHVPPHLLHAENSNIPSHYRAQNMPKHAVQLPPKQPPPRRASNSTRGKMHPSSQRQPQQRNTRGRSLHNRSRGRGSGRPPPHLPQSNPPGYSQRTQRRAQIHSERLGNNSPPQPMPNRARPHRPQISSAPMQGAKQHYPPHLMQAPHRVVNSTSHLMKAPRGGVPSSGSSSPANAPTPPSAAQMHIQSHTPQQQPSHPNQNSSPHATQQIQNHQILPPPPTSNHQMLPHQYPHAVQQIPPTNHLPRQVGMPPQMSIMSTPTYVNASMIMRDPTMYPVTFISPQHMQKNAPPQMAGISAPNPQQIASSKPPVATSQMAQTQPIPAPSQNARPIAGSINHPPHPMSPNSGNVNQPHPARPISGPTYQIARRPPQRPAPPQPSTQGHIPYQPELAPHTPYQTQSSNPMPPRRKSPNPNPPQQPQPQPKAKTSREPSPQPAKEEPEPSQSFRILRRKKPVQADAQTSNSNAGKRALTMEERRDERKRRYDELKQELIQKEEQRNKQRDLEYRREEERRKREEAQAQNRRMGIPANRPPPAGPPQLPVNRSSDLNPFAKEFVPGNW